MRRITALLTAILLTWLPAIADNSVDYGLRMITMDDGLMSNAVRNIVQDRYGFIWFGTDNGLCRYDGTRIHSYRIAENGIDQYVSALCNVDEGQIVGTGRGVFSYSFRTELFSRILPGIKTVVTHITPDKDGNVWIATRDSGLWCYIPRDGKSKHYPMKAFNGNVARILVSNDNQIWAVTHMTVPSLMRLNKVRDRFETVQVKGSNYGSLAIMQTREGAIWLGTWENGLMRLHDDGTLQQVGGPESVARFRHIHTLFDYSPDRILIGCDGGLMSYNPRTGEVNAFHSQLPERQDMRFVYSIHRDSEGGLWIGTFYGGVGYISSMASRFESISGNVISRFCEGADGRVWIASDDGGLRCYLPREHRYIDYPGRERLSHLNVHALCFDGDDLWLGTYTAGVFVLNTKTGAIRNYLPGDSKRTLDDYSSYSIYRDRHNRMWVATMRGLCLYDREHDDFTRVKKFPVMIIDIDEDSGGNLWLSTQGDGLWRLDPKKRWKRYANSEGSTSLSDNQVNCTYIDSGGQMWVATQSGLCRYDSRHDSFERIRLDVPCQAVCGIIEDQGVLWLSGECGIVKYEPGNGVCRFTRQDGLVSEQFQPNSAMKGSDGRIYFGTIRGFNVFSPYLIKINSVAPPVFITSLDLFNRPVEVGSKCLPAAPAFVPEIDLSWRDEMFSVSFASLSYCSPEKNQYAYMLEGFDKQWNYVGTQHKATYTNIPAGTYVFRVKATNNDGVWSTTEARMRIVVHPPFWWSLPAKIFYFLLACALIYYYVHYRLRNAERRHRRELQQLNDDKEKEIRDARLGFFTMVAHEIRTPVSLIIGPMENIRKKQHPAIEADLNVIDRNARRLLELVNQLLDFRKVEQKSLVMRFAPQNICELLRSVCERFEPTFAQGGKRFSVEYPDSHFTAIIDREAIVKVVSNLLTNANKYTKDDVRLVCIEEPDGEHFRIEVTDNGVGIRPDDRERIFMPFYQAQGNKPGTGIGLSIVKDIVDHHGGTITVDSVVGHGSTFTVVLPVSQKMTADVEVPADSVKASAGSAPSVEQNGTLEVVPPQSASKPTLLIVDDNEDMVEFLSANFVESYNVVTAGDGIEALDRIQRLQGMAEGEPGTKTTLVSVIICDWMMPRMDGAELCRRIRQNLATSHIPFVMLTARIDNQSKTESMDVGADAYIEKPFSVSYLQACIRNILELRRMLRERFSTQPLKTVSGIASNAVDDEFLKRMTQLIEDNFSNSALSVNFLAEQLDISRSGLFAKIKSLSDMTPNEMIQVVRLKKAAQLLREGNRQVGEVCYMVGFSNPSYFSKCFFRQFGIRPVDFIKQVQSGA